MKKIFLFLIRVYQYLFSFGLSKVLLINNACRFSPTCSEYTYQAIDRYGTIKGSILGIKRILRCHPFSKGGEDPIKAYVRPK